MKMNNSILIHPDQLIYFYIPKCACTSLKAFFAKHMSLDFFDPHTAPFKTTNVARARMMIENEQWDSFAVVRHPLDRLVSLYLDKVRPGYRGWGFPDGVERFVFSDFKEIHEDMSFDEFAYTLFDLPDWKTDPHFTPQFEQIQDSRRVVPRKIFKMEQMYDLLDFLSSKGFDPGELKHANKTERKVHWREMYSIRLMDRAKEYYKQDLINFEYD